MKRIRNVRWVLVIQLNDDEDLGLGCQGTALDGMETWDKFTHQALLSHTHSQNATFS